MVLSVIRKLFNKIFTEETKDKLRGKFIRFFIFMDKRIVYREYLKACKYILRQKIYGHKTTDYAYRMDSSLKRIKEEYLYTKIKSEIAVGRLYMDEEMQECLERVRKDGFDVYCGSLNNVHIYAKEDIRYDTENCLYYGLYEGKRLYFSEKFRTVEEVLKYMNEIAAEQSEHSPHKYLTKDFDTGRDDIVFDIGCAEGNFSLSIADRVKEIYLFEAEEAWMQPLKLTFAPYMDKVHIIQKYVSKNNTAQTECIDHFCRKNNINKIDFVKMDVEGAEQDVIMGAKEMIRQSRINKMAICTYHKVNDENTIRALLSNYRIMMAEGYMLHTVQGHDLWNMELPCFTRGVLRAELNKQKKENVYDRTVSKEKRE